MFKIICFLLLSFNLFFFVDNSKAKLQNNKNKGFTSKTRGDDCIRIAFYNVENLFDVYDDTLKNDDAFTPEGKRAWTKKRFYKKINNLYKTIAGIGEWTPPEIIGLCEVENRAVLTQLIKYTPLKKYNYKIIHFESPDVRGIDVALLYRSDKVNPVFFKNIQVNFDFDSTLKTRDILYVKALLFDIDTVHFFVNHWPSRYSGYNATVPKRKAAALVLRDKVDSLFALNAKANIIIMGDFNDEPERESLSVVLKAKTDTLGINSSDLVNLMYQYQNNSYIGTIKRENSWSVFDQFICSGALFKGQNGLSVRNSQANIFTEKFLFLDDDKYFGKKLFRTYLGFKYLGGYSDHLPIFLDLINN